LTLKQYRVLREREARLLAKLVPLQQELAAYEASVEYKDARIKELEERVQTLELCASRASASWEQLGSGIDKITRLACASHECAGCSVCASPVVHAVEVVK